MVTLGLCRYYSGGTLWGPQEAEAKQDSLHQPAAGSPGKDLLQDTLSRCGDAGEISYDDQPS